MTSGSTICHAEANLGCEALIGIIRYPGGCSDGATYMLGRYTLMPTKSTGAEITLRSSSVNWGASTPASVR
jgi:hypothetical protein